MGRPPKGDIAIGDVAVVDIGPVAHGGHCIAHHAGHTLLVRHALPGERVRVRITDVTSKVSRADVIEVMSASVDRVTAPCPWAGACGGCDFQHVTLDAQRRMKAQVIEEALGRAGGWTAPVHVEALPGDGLHWRTRMRWAVDGRGVPGLRAHRSHAVVPVGACLLASPGIDGVDIPAMRVPGAQEVRVAEGSDGEVTVCVDGEVVRGRARVEQVVGPRSWRVSMDSFWQVHPEAAPALVEAAISMAAPRPGERWWDLFAGVGLFSAFLATAVGEGGHVEAIEGAAAAVRDARRSLHDLVQVRLHEGEVRAWVTAPHDPVDGVLLDPPRAGAGAAVVEGIARARPRVVVYVACDPVALARDVASFAATGYRVAQVRAFDTFPMTHHVETVAALVPSGADDQIS